MRYVDPDGKYSWEQFESDLGYAFKYISNIDFGLDYSHIASETWANGDYFNAIIYELDATCEMILDFGIAYLGAVTLGAVIESMNLTVCSSGSASEVKETVKNYSPINQGPLSNRMAKTFRGGSYSEVTLQSDTILYRVYGGTASKIGAYWTRTVPTGPLQSQIDLALRPEWGNTAENIVKINVPAGTTIFEGFAESQGAGLLGGGSQVIILNVNPNWVIP